MDPIIAQVVLFGCLLIFSALLLLMNYHAGTILAKRSTWYLMWISLLLAIVTLINIGISVKELQ